MITVLLLTILLSPSLHAQTSQIPGPQCIANISDKEAAAIGEKIWMLEGGKTILIWWDDTAESASFGINNYLWFQEGLDVPFEESFPPLLEFIVSRGVKTPEWISPQMRSPWRSRAELFGEVVTLDRYRRNPPPKWGMTPAMFATQDSPRVKELKEFLERTISLQARFSAQRMVDALPKMLAASPAAGRRKVEKQFYRVACSTGGLFNLIDYVNFKGEGTNLKERYRGPRGEKQGWGLLQVLGHMAGERTGPIALNEFADSAQWAIKRRVRNAPKERKKGDSDWLAGWLKRIENYRAP